jgi:hypothetical protein
MRGSVLIFYWVGAEKCVFPWYSAAMLAFEANHVIALRLSKLAFGGAEAHYEATLMITEKIDAAMEASYNLIRNGGHLGSCCSLPGTRIGKCKSADLR